MLQRGAPIAICSEKSTDSDSDSSHIGSNAVLQIDSNRPSAISHYGAKADVQAPAHDPIAELVLIVAEGNRERGRATQPVQRGYSTSSPEGQLPFNLTNLLATKLIEDQLHLGSPVENAAARSKCGANLAGGCT
jgi:hypothetical protein